MSRRVYVGVTLEMDASGRRSPLAVTWEDNTTYEITHATYVGRRRAKSAGSGDCWMCRIGRHDVPLYYAPLTGRWWVDGKGDPEPAPKPTPYRRVKDRNYRPPT
ncbi:MAG: hypothetical protein ACOYH4_04325 [Saccharofermentanales bacterium]|jgi:hypothetical protein